MDGWAGLYLRVNLSDGKITKGKLSKGFLRAYVGGIGFTTRILFDEVKAGVDPLGPDNKLVIAVGPCNGTLVSASCRYTLAAKSPLSGLIGDSNAGGRFGVDLKYAGYDLLIIEGKAAKPMYLWINDDDVELKNAEHLWGMTTGETRRAIEQDGGDPEISVLSIGPAGENLVKFACVVSDIARVHGRCGLGAVMGSKKLKAIAVSGSKGVSVADAEALESVVKDMYQMYHKHQEWYKSIATYGVVKNLVEFAGLGTIPVKNFQGTKFEGIEELSHERLKDSYLVASRACFSCPVRCNQFWVIGKGPYKGTYGEALELMQPMRFGLLLGNKNLDSILKMSEEANQLGLDVADLSGVIAFALECTDKGILDRKLLDGCDWGDYEGILRLFQKISYRKGIGDILAEGLKEASKKIGKGSEEYALHVKGLSIEAYDPRAVKGWGLGYAIASRGADHCRHLFVSERDAPDRLEIKGKAEAIVWHENIRAFQNCLEVCGFCSPFLDLMDPDLQAKLFTAVTGYKIEAKDVLVYGERVVNLARAFNVREGLTRKDDTLPDRFLKVPMPDGAAKGEIIELKPMVDRYYELRGWDKDTGFQTEEKLLELGLDDVVNVLKKCDKLAHTTRK